MCCICTLIILEKLNITEASKAATELINSDHEDKEHIVELKEALDELDLDKLDKLIQDPKD